MGARPEGRYGASWAPLRQMGKTIKRVKRRREGEDNCINKLFRSALRFKTRARGGKAKKASFNDNCIIRMNTEASACLFLGGSLIRKKEAAEDIVKFLLQLFF